MAEVKIASNIEMDKKSIRKVVLERRRCVSAKDRQEAERTVAGLLRQHRAYKECEYVLGYAGTEEEIGTGFFLTEALREGKRVFLPKVMGKRHMEFFEIDSLEQLVPGAYGIMEPSGGERIFVPETMHRALMIMPGVAFDSRGNRIGYGGGFYDTYLEKYGHQLEQTIAIGFTCQEVERVPTGEHDIPPGEVILV